MKFKILWSAWAIPTPRPFNDDWLSKLAREKWWKYIRNSSCFWLEDIALLVDCPESIWESANKENIENIKNLFITHWHPDHAFWLRVVLESRYNFRLWKTEYPIDLYMPKQVYDDLKKVYPSIDFFVNERWTAKLNFIEHGEKVQIENITVEAVWYQWAKSSTYWYKFSSNWKTLLYAPCDTISFKQDLSGLDVLVHECWIFSYDIVKSEISFPDAIDRIRKYKPKKTIFTHIEHVEIERRWLDYLSEMKEKYSDVDFQFAYDGFEIVL